MFTAKIPKPPQSHRAGVSVLNAQGRQQNLAAVRGALTQFNQQGARMQGKTSVMDCTMYNFHDSTDPLKF